ncbi:cytidylyltransferase domain-containing protein [Cohnella sp. JJ-181]|uniref:acylneuraminate cytidylyltransferase family protein n=1 Tax=Cohnella rhizoplanae TaxID=2974897 RepID=UPI0022FFB8A2|nr:acylneuraminate cytidylyltransferase family protein [Cohnella sp. JJ-181]CAI6084369.1 CMP-N,N'-diacetyllegionaminic acid synthase [Cohnella sp. JJ-181]
MKRLCSICARGGSKGVPNKNIRLLNGRPLISYSIEHAKETGLFEAIAVSSDSEEILEVARASGADILVKRPPEMASDQAPKVPAIRHCFTEAENMLGIVFDTSVDLDATSPLRHASDIVRAVRLLEDTGVSNVITGMPARRSPYFNLVEINERGVAELSKRLPAPVVRRQDSPLCYDMNGSIYVWTRSALLENDTLFLSDTRLYEMPEERSIDIDHELEWEWVSFLMNKRSESQ